MYYLLHTAICSKCTVIQNEIRVSVIILQEMESNEKLRAQLTSLEIKVEQQKREIGESKTRLQIEEGKQEDGEMMESKGWKSAVVTRMYEEKLKSLEADLEKKVGIMLTQCQRS